MASRVVQAFVILTSTLLGFGADGPEPQAGASYLVSGSWFQYLGRADGGDRLWLYPHVDGVQEIFTERSVPGVPWEGLLGSRYDPAAGTFADRFNAAEVLNEVLEREAPATRRREAERLLLLFAEVHEGEAVPFYVEPEAQRLRRQLPREDLEWVEDRARIHRAALGRVGRPGTRVPSLAEPLSSGPGPEEYYRRMVCDGYLDVAVVGGNLRHEGTREYLSWGSIEAVRSQLDEQGFSPAAFRRAADAVIREKSVQLRGATIRVRVIVTGGSQRPDRIRRAAANFVEGLAHADVLLYHGHSNHDSGIYYTSETRSRLSRFRIGRGETRDLSEKCHGLATKTYQILALQSCTSYEKYCRPLRWFLERSAPASADRGFIGNAELADASDFGARFGEFIGLLLEERGARDIAERLNRIRVSELTCSLVLRGLLQPSFTFVVPAGVEISEYEELSGRGGSWVVGTGTDARRYVSSEIFPQNVPGEVVQVLECSLGVLGLYDDGRLWIVERRGGGAARETRLSKEKGLRFRFLGQAPLHGAARVFLVSPAGSLHVLNERTGALEDVRPRPPDGTAFQAVGASADGALLLQDTTGAWLRWDPGRRELRPLDSPPKGAALVPSLLGAGGPARLWSPEGALDRSRSGSRLDAARPSA